MTCFISTWLRARSRVLILPPDGSIMKRISLLFLLFLILLSACGQAPPPVAGTATTTLTLTITRNPGIYTHVNSYSSQLTLSPEPNSTPVPNPTIKAAFSSIKSTEEAWDNVSVPATQSVKATQIASFRVSCETDTALVSPDANWLAATCLHDPMDYEQGVDLLLFDRNGNIKFRVVRKNIFNYRPEKPLQLGAVSPFHWSNDSQMLYFTLEDYRGDAVVMDSRGPLFGLNITTGVYTQITKGEFNHYSFSPTNRRLLVIDQDLIPLSISIMDLKSGMKNEISIPEARQGSDSLWSPDGTKFVFVTSDDYLQKYSVILVDVVYLTYYMIISGHYDYFTPVKWGENNIIEIIARKYDSTFNVNVPFMLFYNVTSDALSEGSPTP